MQRMHLTAWAGACLFVLAAGCGGTSEAQPASDASVESTATPLAAAPTTAERAAKARKIAKARARYLKELAARKAAETKAKAEAARQLALTRQKELASYGYRIAIDGDWGPRSKGAWAEYQLRKGESYASSWGADAIVVISGLTNGSETLDRILNSLAFTDTYSETEFTSAVSALRNCQVSLFGSQPPLREGYEAVLQLAAQGCDAYQSALDQLPQAMGSDDYVPFSGVQAALRQGDARFASVGYELDRAVGVLGLSGGSSAPAPTPDYNAPAPESSYGGDLDCVDFDGPIDVSGGDPHGLDGDGDGIGCE